MTRPTRILEIDELVLHGFDPRDRRRIGEAVQVELQALLAGAEARRLEPRPADRLNAGQFQADGLTARQVGRLTARQLHRSLF